MLIVTVTEILCVLLKHDKSNAVVIFYTNYLLLEGNDGKLESYKSLVIHASYMKFSGS